MFKIKSNILLITGSFWSRLRGKSSFIAGAFALLLFVLPMQAAENIQTATLHDGKELLLNGLGRAKQLSDSFYLGALYLETPYRSVDNITYINNYKRMQLRIVSKRVSARRFAQYWKESISINNPRNIWEPQVKDVLAFTGFFKKTLKSGDIVNLDYIPSLGTFIHVNGVAIGRIRNPGFYNLLMMTWLGSRPPNDQFRLGIMGGNDGDTAIQLQNEFNLLKPTEARIAESKKWLDESPEEVKVAEQKPAAKKKTPEKKTALTKKTTKKPVVKNTPATKKKAVATNSKQVTKGTPSVNADLAVVTPAIVTPAIVTPKVTKNSKAKTKPKSNKKASVEAPKKLSSSEKLKLYAARNDYEKILRTRIRKFQQYPIRKMLRNRTFKKQMEKGQIESEGVLWVKIARDGSVISSKLEQSTGISILDKSAIDMVEKADPLPEMPLLLLGDDFEFLVQLKFVSPNLD